MGMVMVGVYNSRRVILALYSVVTVTTHCKSDRYNTFCGYIMFLNRQFPYCRAMHSTCHLSRSKSPSTEVTLTIR